MSEAGAYVDLPTRLGGMQGYLELEQLRETMDRLADERPADPPEVAPPSGLALTEEPRANVERYEGLRGQTAGVRHAS